jgi:dTDP-4-amino-4,6-dideoxygalactose transaminase
VRHRTRSRGDHGLAHGRGDRLREFLAEKGIGTLDHYPVPVHLQPAYAGRVKVPFPLKNTENIADEILSLPMFPELTSGEADEVIAAIAKFKD